jgi:PAS domain S-box-containing protein
MTALRGTGSFRRRSVLLLVLGTVSVIALPAGLASALLWNDLSTLDVLGGLRDRPATGLVIAGLVITVTLALAVALFLISRQRDRALDLLHATLAHMDQGLVLLGPDQRADIYNRRALELLELPEQLLARRPLPAEVLSYQSSRGEFATMPPEAVEVMLRGLPARAPSRYERVRPNGTVLEIRASPLPNGGALKTYSDITERRKAIDDMNASMAFANSLVNSSPDCIQLLDLDGNISFMSDLGQEQFEVEDFETVRGKPFSSFFAEEHRARIELALRRVRDGQTDRFTRMCPTLGGVAKWWDFIITPVHEIGRPPERLFVVARDISARQAHAEELSRAKEAAERASQAKTQFLASMSHEIRTPLNAILGFASLARDRRDRDPELRRQMELIQKAGESLLTIINDVLDLSKIEAGRIELEERPLALRGLVEDCLSLTCGLATQKGIALECLVSPSIPARIVADEARLRQVLLNLLNNAVKFTASGSVVLSVVPVRDGRALTVSITDTGIGISPERSALLFQDFVQGDGSINRQYGGTGLGLSISRRLITLMGGDIGVASVVGQGSTFHFTLPLIEAEPEIDADAAQGPSEPHVVTPRAILLVDDLSINLEIVGEMLRSAGHRVTFASDGPSAIAAYRQDRHDLILMDVQMPDMDGLETTRRIRDLDGQARQVPVIALTANVFSQQIESYRDAGMNDHLGKPLHRDALLAMIERWTSPAERDAGSASTDAEAGPPALDRKCQSELARLIGVEKAHELLMRFREELPDRFSSAAPEALKADAHALASTAGLLGFAKLSAAAGALEQAIETGGDVSPQLSAVLAGRKDVLRRIDELAAAMAAAKRGEGDLAPAKVA